MLTFEGQVMKKVWKLGPLLKMRHLTMSSNKMRPWSWQWHFI